VTFDQFANFIFDHSPSPVEWYLAEDFVPPELRPEIAVVYTKDLFANARMYANKYSESQFCSGLEYLVNPACSDHCYFLLDQSVKAQNRIEVMTAMYEVFDGVFANKCNDVLMHSTSGQGNRYNYICYMWWDVFPRHGAPAKRELANTDRQILNVLARIVELKSVACKEAALHGLGHWYFGYPELVEEIIDANRSSIPANLVQYAQDARVGRVQ
jgi:hypothetical protein